MSQPRLLTDVEKRQDLTETLKRTCVVLVHLGIDAGQPEERLTSLETWSLMLWQIADAFAAQEDPAPNTHLLVRALRQWVHAARRSAEADGIGQAGFDTHMLAHVNALAEWEQLRINARVLATQV
ncbi:hypothetical protein [Nocardiopsis synnemataformans]|uniref:hypothetical protein n=1 Tax=Nocardiopsis synnemataformans TaxID=61305 RepID=UPI003EB868DC